MVEKLIKAGYLRRYIKEIDHGVESGQTADRVTVDVVSLLESRLAINYILGGPSVKPEKNQIFLKNGKTVNYRYSIG